MCGLVALYSYSCTSGAVDESELAHVVNRMDVRGPDGEGVWIKSDRRVALGHRRLAVIDLTDAGAQPMSNATSTVRVVFNGEIYNHIELRALLKSKGRVFRTTSDTEVLVQMYEEFGVSMLAHLRGMYAFAIWDEKKRGIFIARDPFGIKPLYYADDGGCIRIASQVKAILAGDRTSKSIDPAGTVGFLIWGHIPEPYTMYRSIRALPAGSWMWVDENGATQPKNYFSIKSEILRAEERRHDIDKHGAMETLRQAVKASVSHHLVSDVPVGIFLSSGIDSACLLGLSRELGVRGMKAITIGYAEFASTPSDELPYAQQVAALYEARHVTKVVNINDFELSLDMIFDNMDQPTIDGINSFLVSAAAREFGSKVVLSGLGGDELFGGYPSFRDIPSLVRVMNPMSKFPLLGRGIRKLGASVLPRSVSPKYAGIAEYGGNFASAYLLRRALYMPWEVNSLLDNDTIVEGLGRLETIEALSETIAGISSPQSRVMALEMSWYMRNQLLRDADWASMAHSIELRVPLIDVDLFCAACNAVAAGCLVNKSILATLPKNTIPRVIASRSKTGFTVPVQTWIRRLDGTKNKFRERGYREWAKYVIGRYTQ